MLLETIKQALTITGFVFVMMLVIEYMNVLTRGTLEKRLEGRRWRQTFLGSVLGAIPGCLGSFAAVSMYSHRIITAGALVATMIATSGDEAFVMLAMFPGDALKLFGILFVLALISGLLLDMFPRFRRTATESCCSDQHPAHEHEERCVCFSFRELLDQWKGCTAHRGILTFVLMLFSIGIVTGDIGHTHLGAEIPDDEIESVADRGEHAEHLHDEGGAWDWVRFTMLIVGLVGLGIVSTVPDHFLDSHLWNHIAKDHIWKVFFWTAGALFVLHLLIEYLHLADLVGDNLWSVLAIACLAGLIPQSGPHLVFVMLYASHDIPFSILLASCIVQDGHGMLPMLAHSRRAFLGVKLIKLAIGLAVGAAALALGW